MGEPDFDAVIEKLQRKAEVCICKPFCVHWEVWAKKVLVEAFAKCQHQKQSYTFSNTKALKTCLDCGSLLFAE